MCLSIADPITRDFFLLKYSGKSVPPPKNLLSRVFLKLSLRNMYVIGIYINSLKKKFFFV